MTELRLEGKKKVSVFLLHFYLTDMRKRHDQLGAFVKCGMIPTYRDGQLNDNPVIGHGRLTKVWLGGLVNPEALLTSLRQEKAVVSQCHIDDVSEFHFTITNPHSSVVRALDLKT